MSDLPASVEFHEEGPREGFQMERQTYPLAERAALIDALAASGLKQIQVASFVSPRAVPQMADTAELFGAIVKRPGIRYITLGIPEEKAYVVGCNLGDAVPLLTVTDQVRRLIDACADRGVTLPAGYLADTMGWAHPEEIKRRVGGPNVHVALHMGVRLSARGPRARRCGRQYLHRGHGDHLPGTWNRNRNPPGGADQGSATGRAHHRPHPVGPCDAQRLAQCLSCRSANARGRNEVP